MIKILAILAGGVFVGAVGVEIVRRKYPRALDNLYAKTRKTAAEAKEAFKNGYANATRAKAAQVST